MKGFVLFDLADRPNVDAIYHVYSNSDSVLAMRMARVHVRCKQKSSIVTF